MLRDMPPWTLILASAMPGCLLALSQSGLRVLTPRASEATTLPLPSSSESCAFCPPLSLTSHLGKPTADGHPVEHILATSIDHRLLRLRVQHGPSRHILSTDGPMSMASRSPWSWLLPLDDLSAKAHNRPSSAYFVGSPDGPCHILVLGEGQTRLQRCPGLSNGVAPVVGATVISVMEREGEEAEDMHGKRGLD